LRMLHPERFASLPPGSVLTIPSISEQSWQTGGMYSVVMGQLVPGNCSARGVW
jgi:hypothetical protein